MSTQKSNDSVVDDYDRLETVIDITNRITSVLSLDQLLATTVQTISRNLRFAHVGLLMAQGNRLVLRAASDQRANQLVGKFSVEIGKEGITGWVAASGQPLLVPDVNLDPRYVSLDTGIKVRAALAVPLRINHKTIGVIDADASDEAKLDENDLWLMERVSSQIAIAIQNARHYARLQRYARGLEEQVRQRTAERDEAVQYLLAREPLPENDEQWQAFQDSYRLRLEKSTPHYDPPIPGTSTGEETFPESSVLTAREIKILELIAQGLTDKGIAQRFVISPHTVNAHLRSIYRKLHTHSRTGAVNLARRKQIIP